MKWTMLLVAAAIPGAVAVTAQQATQKTAPEVKPVEIRVSPVPPTSPSVTITLGKREGKATPERQGFAHTGGGNTDVAQPAPDTLVITMTGVAVATCGPCCAGSAAMELDLNQEFDVVFEKSDVKAAKLTLEARAIGLLRSHKGGGAAEISNSAAHVSNQAGHVVSVSLPDHSVSSGDNLSINDHAGPVSATIGAGSHVLTQTVKILANHSKSPLPCKAASAEFAPDPALDPLWISYWEPFHGAAKKDLGVQVSLKVEAASETELKMPEVVPGEPKKIMPEKVPAPPKKVGNRIGAPSGTQPGVERVQFSTQYPPRLEALTQPAMGEPKKPYRTYP